MRIYQKVDDFCYGRDRGFIGFSLTIIVESWGGLYVGFRVYKRLCLEWATRANASLIYNFLQQNTPTPSATLLRKVVPKHSFFEHIFYFHYMDILYFDFWFEWLRTSVGFTLRALNRQLRHAGAKSKKTHGYPAYPVFFPFGMDFVA